MVSAISFRSRPPSEPQTGQKCRSWRPEAQDRHKPRSDIMYVAVTPLPIRLRHVARLAEESCMDAHPVRRAIPCSPQKQVRNRR